MSHIKAVEPSIRKIPLKNVLLFIINLYRKYLSPMKSVRCPYIPSCSAYAYEAITVHGAVKGSLLSAYRILRCNPFSNGGYDPVPLKRDIFHVKNKEYVPKVSAGHYIINRHGTEKC